MRLLIIDNYDSFTYNVVQLVEQCGLFDYMIVKNDKLLNIDPNVFQKVLISPGPGTAAEAGELMEFLLKVYKSKPILGICLGYEAIGKMFGARLSKMDEPMHGIKNHGEIIVNDKIFTGLPGRFAIGHYHSWIIYETDMPAELGILLKDENGMPMAVRHRSLDIKGLMFHPESIMTDFGKEMIGNWLSA
ncbi:MAG: aminodeoxychorismate/anthranilate synthase component II [Chlorobi bacterium]|nr:aminodeoxychorismate/anthranilate synthase component II [Chlorobiota bacterium]